MRKFVVLLFSVMMFAGPRTILDGVYTSQQATRGEALYENHCVQCHEGSDADGPPLVGRSFVDRWREDNLDVLFNYTKNRMPANDPGKLTDAADLDIVAYLLRANGYPLGDKDLALDALASIRFVGKDGPKPLPTNTLVQVIGCLSQHADNTWMLTRATHPVRNRQGTETTREELKISAERPLGAQTFRLQNFTNIRFDFKPDPFNGHKVQVRGVLIRQTNNDRISVTALDSVASSCP